MASELFKDRRILQRRNVLRDCLTLRQGTQEAAHDLTRSRLGEILTEANIFRLGNRPDFLGHVVLQLLDHLARRFADRARALEHDEGTDRLAGQFVRPADHSRFGDHRVRNEYLGVPVHLAHISCEKSVALIRFAKARGVDVTAETCPHYLTLTDDEATGYSALAKVSPPLRPRADVDALLDALAEGVIDMLATDHAPHAAHEKEVEFDQAPCGISGLDTALATTWELVRAGKLPFDAFLRAWTSAPCKRFGLPLNTFAPGDPADFVLFDQDATWSVDAQTMYSKSKNTPLFGRSLRGRVAAHFLAGKMVIGGVSSGA